MYPFFILEILFRILSFRPPLPGKEGQNQTNSFISVKNPQRRRETVFLFSPKAILGSIHSDRR